jgi:small subunit ribosomal protein S4
MSRYTGPRLKIMRALGVELPGLSRKPIGARKQPPGQHGARLRKKSDFGIQLQEKQKLRFNYGVSERQMRRLMGEAKASRAQTGNKLLELLERRLDNLVFRAGYAPTVLAARQLVNHRHLLLNGRPADIPSIRVKPGDCIQLTAKAAQLVTVRECLAEPPLSRPAWIAFDAASGQARVLRLPEADEVPFPIDMQQVVEYYAVRL